MVLSMHLRSVPARVTLATMTISGCRTVAAPSSDKQRPKIGVALSWGGAISGASFGLLKALHREIAPPFSFGSQGINARNTTTPAIVANAYLITLMVLSVVVRISAAVTFVGT
jgi:hypothetical protein